MRRSSNPGEFQAQPLTEQTVRVCLTSIDSRPSIFVAGGEKQVVLAKFLPILGSWGGSRPI